MSSISHLILKPKSPALGKSLALALVALSSALANPNQEASKEDLATQKVDSVVTTAGGFNQSLLLAPASISLVKPEELLSRPVRDLGEALSLVPGVDIDNGVGKTGGYGISIRGLGAAYTLILVDGKRVNASASDSVFPNGFGDSLTSFMPPVSAIERIEVLRGPASTLYGSDAIGGVVNIITKKNFQKWGASIAYDYTVQEKKYFGNSQSISFYTAGPLTASKNFGLALRGRLYTRDHVPLANLAIVPSDTNNAGQVTRTNIVGLSFSRIFGVGGRFLWNEGREASEARLTSPVQSAYFDVDYGQQFYDNSSGLLGTYDATAQESEAQKQSKNGYGREYNIYRANLLANWDGIFLKTNEGLLRSFSLNNSLQYNSIFNPNRYLTNTVFPGANQATGLYGYAPGDSRNISNHDLIADSKGKLSLAFKPGFGAEVSFGGRYWFNAFYDNIMGASGGNSLATQHIGALFAESEFVLWDTLFITAGLRGNFNSIFGANVSPRLYISYNAIDEWLTIKGGISTGYKTPALSNLVKGVIGLTRQGKVPIYGNPGLGPESSTSYELSFLSDNEWFEGSITAFITDFRDKITSTGTIANNQTIPGVGIQCNTADGCQSYINRDRALSYGAEIYAELKPLFVGYGEISLNLSYTVNQTLIIEGEGKGRQLTDIPLHNLNGAIFYNTPYGGLFLRAEMKAKQHRGIYGTDSASLAQLKALGEFFKPYFLAHLGFSTSYFKGLKLTAGIYNLFDFNFVDYVGVKDNGKTAYYNNYNYIREGRRYYVSLSYEF